MEIGKRVRKAVKRIRQRQPWPHDIKKEFKAIRGHRIPLFGGRALTQLASTIRYCEQDVARHRNSVSRMSRLLSDSSKKSTWNIQKKAEIEESLLPQAKEKLSLAQADLKRAESLQQRIRKHMELTG